MYFWEVYVKQYDVEIYANDPYELHMGRKRKIWGDEKNCQD